MGGSSCCHRDMVELEPYERLDQRVLSVYLVVDDHDRQCHRCAA
jgi:hypothetical protein